jgi:hypothetical protein
MLGVATMTVCVGVGFLVVSHILRNDADPRA